MSDTRPTPETDAAIADGHTFNHEDLRPVIALCQRLERQRDEAADQIETLVKQNAELNRQLTNEQKNHYALASHHNQHCTCMEIY